MLIKTQRLVGANAEMEGDSCYLFTGSSLDHLMGALQEFPDKKFIIFYLCWLLVLMKGKIIKTSTILILVVPGHADPNYSARSPNSGGIDANVCG